VEKTNSRYRIGLVSHLTGISTHQLRIWERRYEAVAPARSEGGDRLYSDSDIARLRTLKRLSDWGHSIGRVAQPREEERDELLAVHPPGPSLGETSLLAHRVLDQFLTCIGRMDLLDAERCLSRACVAFDPTAFVAEVLLPLMRGVGQRWASGEFSIAQERGASRIWCAR